MIKHFLNLNKEEKDSIEKLSSLSCIDEKTIKAVFQALLKAITIEQYVGIDEFCIPYIGFIKLSSFEKFTEKGVKTIVEIEAKPSKHLTNEIKAINEGEIAPTQNFIRQNFYDNIESILRK